MSAKVERCGRCAAIVEDVVWWCWYCGAALCPNCGDSDRSTCGSHQEAAQLSEQEVVEHVLDLRRRGH